jgi:hypothetical protein
MFLWFRKLFRAQINLNRALCATPFMFKEQSLFLIPLRSNSLTAHRINALILCITFLYIGVAIWNQVHYQFIWIEQFMLSLTSSVVLVALGVYKLILFQRPAKIIQLINTLSLFEITNFGKNSFIQKLAISKFSI